MLCFEGHHVTTLGEITSKDGNRTEIHELESISRVVQEGKAKVNVKLSKKKKKIKKLELNIVVFYYNICI